MTSQITDKSMVRSTAWSREQQVLNSTITGPLWVEYTGAQWIPLQRVSDAESVSMSYVIVYIT